jgi:GNAT superfamily N-acetyltransferase
VFIGAPGGWPLYARPRLGGTGPFDAAAVRSLLARMRELDVALAIEWVHDVTPELLEAVRSEGSLEVKELPLLVLLDDTEPPQVPDDIVVRMLGPEDEELLLQVSGVQELAFGPRIEPPPGVRQRDAAGRAPSATLREQLRSGDARIAVAEHPQRGILAAGKHQAVGQVTEVVGVATLPAEQGAGLASAVTRVLVEDARAHGISTIFLTASSERVAPIYARLGFRRVATGYAAEAGKD